MAIGASPTTDHVNTRMRMRDLIDICEAMTQDATLYHATDVLRGARILYQDEIKPQTDHFINGKTMLGVSLTRSFRFAVDWRRFGIVYSLDAVKLRHRSKIIPTDYYRDRREHEEFLIGGIKPLSKFLTGILITPETEAYCKEHDNELIEGHKDYEDLLRHPLLKIMAFPDPLPYYNPRTQGKNMFAGLK
jgi:hypothetical protein